MARRYVTVGDDYKLSAFVRDEWQGETADDFAAGDVVPRVERSPIAASVKPFDNRLSLYNWKPSNTAKLRAAIAKANAGEHQKIVFVGDSITAATPFTGWDLIPYRDSYVYRVADALEAAGTPIAGDGPVFAGNGSATADQSDGRWTFGVPANWTTHTDLHGLNASTNGATATFTSTRPGTIVDIWYYDTGGPWSYSIDGATAVTVTPGTTGATLSVQVTGLADTTHTVLITTTSAALSWVLGVAVRRATGLSVINAGIGGSTTFKWRPGAGTLPLQVVTAVDPDSSFVMLEANDVDAQLSIATYTTQLTAIVTQLLTHGDVVLMISPPADPGGAGFGFNKIAYDTANYAIADTFDLPVVDFQHHFIDWTTFNTTLGYALDQVHPTRQANADMGEMLTQLLAGASTKRAATVPALVGSPLGATLTGGCANMDRGYGLASMIATGSGLVELTYFQVPYEFVAANMAFYTGSTAAGATPTLVKYALFEVASNGDLRRIAITANNTALLAGTNTRYSQALLAPVRLRPGVFYATAELIVTGAALPTLLGPTQTTVTQTAASQPPRMHGVITGQTDIATSYTAASVLNTALRYFTEITT